MVGTRATVSPDLRNRPIARRRLKTERMTAGFGMVSAFGMVQVNRKSRDFSKRA
ncbi:MAG TPA: hypothetical protein VFP43_24955 [Mesorhizobium sp.]|nr:hypothetical protein [Mesorhizobium sp.]